MTKAPKPHINFQKLPSPWALLREAAKDCHRHGKAYLKILAIVAIPVNIMYATNLIQADVSFETYASLATVIMNVALLWAIIRIKTGREVPGPAAAYYDGSIAIVRYLLAAVGIVLMLVPSAFGLSLLIASLSVADSSGITGPEQLLVALVALIFTLPSAYWVVRYFLAPLITVWDGLRPVAALQRARRLTLGRFWAVAGRLAFLVLVILGVFLIAAVITFGVWWVTRSGNVSLAFFQLLITVTALPLADVYIASLYASLVDTSGDQVPPISSTKQ